MINVFKVDGMSCRHCEKRVTDTVSKLNGVVSVTASAVDGTVTVEGDCDLAAVRNAIEDAGYDVA